MILRKLARALAVVSAAVSLASPVAHPQAPAQTAPTKKPPATKPAPRRPAQTAPILTFNSSDRDNVRDETFHSESLQRDMKYRVILPAGYATSQRRYPVLYLLHGARGTYVDWESHSNVAEYVRTLPLIVVMPDAPESWYTNSVANPQERYEDYIVRDVIPEVEAKFRAITTTHARAIAGLSMGGYGAMKFALKYPRLFVFAASFSGAFEVPGGVEHKPSSPFHDEWLAIFGPADDPRRADNDLIALAQKPAAKFAPYLWLSCGTADDLLPDNREFVRVLHERGLAYEYHETPGAHTWDYWDQQIRAVLPALEEHLKLK